MTSLFVHHDNKAGAAYKPSNGARFLDHLKKARGVYGPAAAPYEAWLQTLPDGRQNWTTRDLVDERVVAIRAAQAEGITSVRGVAKQADLPYTTVQRLLKRNGRRTEP